MQIEGSRSEDHVEEHLDGEAPWIELTNLVSSGGNCTGVDCMPVQAANWDFLQVKQVALNLQHTGQVWMQELKYPMRFRGAYLLASSSPR